MIQALTREMRLLGYVFSINVKDSVYYPSKMYINTVNMITRCFLVIYLFSVAYQFHGGDIKGVSFEAAAWSMFFYFIFLFLSPRDITNSISNEIKSGKVEMRFTKPISYLGYHFFDVLGKNFYSFCVVTIMGLVTLGLTVGFPEQFTQPFFWFTAVLCLIACVLLSFVYKTRNNNKSHCANGNVGLLACLLPCLLEHFFS